MDGESTEMKLVEARALRDKARAYRAGAEYADDPAARRRDLEQAASLERTAAALEREAAES